jgi:decaprenylphospho-beta-D-erythro-pentofuranosid-2-ulose 2-reductase
VTRTILVLGATSAIAAAYCRRAAGPTARFVLVARNVSHLEAVAADLRARGASEVVSIVTDLSEMIDCDARFTDFCSRLGMPDEVLFAYGALGTRIAEETDAAEIRRIISVNFTSVAVWLQAAANLLPKEDPRLLIVISSVAGDRGRRSNYVYGASKAGLDTLTEGLRHRLYGTKLHILTVKPGLVDTPMTTHLDRSGPLWTTPQQVAADIEKAVRLKRTVVYTPWFWSLVMFAIRWTPRAWFYRTNF